MTVYYKRNTNPTNTNWNQADNWSTVSSASSTNTGTFPVALDTATLDSGSVSFSVNVASATAILDCTGYTGTLTFTNTLTTTGNVTLPSGVGGTFAGSGTLSMSGSVNLVPNNMSNSSTPFVPNFITTGSSLSLRGNFYISGNWSVNGNTTWGTPSGGLTIYLAGNLSLVASNLLRGSNPPALVFNASGTQTINGGGVTYYTALDTTFNAVGTISVSTMGYRTGTLSYVAGTITGSGTTYIQGPCTITGFTSGHALPNLNFYSGTNTVTLGSDLYVTTNLTFTSATTFSGAYNIYTATLTAGGTVAHTLSGNITATGNLALATFVMTMNGAGKNIYVGGNLGPSSGSCGIAGTATWVWNCPTAGSWGNSSMTMNSTLQINGAGTFSLGNCVMQSTATLKYINAGSIVNATGTNYLNLYNGNTLDVGTMPTFWNILYITSAGTYTLASDLHANTIQFVAGYTATWAGPWNIYCHELYSVSSGAGASYFMIKSGQTLYVSNSIDMTSQRGMSCMIGSSVGGVAAYLNYSGTTANLYLSRCILQDIDATGSNQPIYSWFGTNLRSIRCYVVNGANIGGGGTTVTNY